MTPQEFEKIDPKQKQAAIREDELERTWYGFCCRCKHKIVAKLKEYPTACPECGYGSN